jgi:hypothetical protein
MPFMNRRASQEYYALRKGHMPFANSLVFLIGLEHITETLKYLANCKY